MSTPPPFLPNSRYGPCGAGGKAPSANAEMAPGRRGRRHANARPSSCVGENIASSAGLLIQPKEGTRKKPAAFARKLRTNSQKRPTFAQELRDFVPRLYAGQRNSESTVRQRAGERSRMRVALRDRRCATNHCAAPSSRNETMGYSRARDPRRSALPHSKAGKGAQALRSAGDNSRCGSATRGAIRICVPTLGDSQGAWSRETRRCHTGAHALSRRQTRRLS